MPELIINKAAKSQVVKMIAAKAFNIPVNLIDSPDRRLEIVYPRAVAMKVLYDETNMSLEQIGKLFGGRDHSTVRHAIQKVEDYCHKDARTFARYGQTLSRFQHLTQTRKIAI